HPSTIHIFRLWQLYIDNINPLLKVTHVPTIQGQILEATAGLQNAPANLETLMFAIYLMAITSLEEPDVERMFSETKRELIARYCTALQQSLVNASFMRINDPLLLQAFTLYLVSSILRSFPHPRARVPRHTRDPTDSHPGQAG